MTEDRTKTEEGAALWRRYSEGRDLAGPADAPEPLLLAAYLDGALSEAEAAHLEAQFAAEPALLDEVLALRASLAAVPASAPAAVVARAQGLHAAASDVRPAAAPTGGWLEGFLGTWLRPAVPVFASLAVVLACAGAFELGRYQADQLASAEAAARTVSEVPVDLLLDDLI